MQPCKAGAWCLIILIIINKSTTATTIALQQLNMIVTFLLGQDGKPGVWCLIIIMFVIAIGSINIIITIIIGTTHFDISTSF